jgi:hypothetical protein
VPHSLFLADELQKGGRVVKNTQQGVGGKHFIVIAV